jgi:pyruvate kinase
LRDLFEHRVARAIETSQVPFDGVGHNLAHNENGFYMRQTKIIATVGPASDSPAVLDALMSGGADIIRLNFAHGTHETHRATYTKVRDAAKRANREVAIMQDLAGPKIRTGPVEDGRPLPLRAGQTLTIAPGDFPGTVERISTSAPGLAAGVRPGDRLLLADGTIELQVESTDGREIVTKVVEGGLLGGNKGINAPGVALAASAITLKDVEDLTFGLSLGIDMVALSFVQTAADLGQARDIIAMAEAGDVPVIAKLERPQAITHLDEILDGADGVMIARGDLGLEMPLERVPRIQKEVTRRARARKVPVILATQVLESMTVEGRPTRAEVSDAANAVADGVDAIMLAGETAVGAFPARAVETLDAIIRSAESDRPRERTSDDGSREHDHAQAICEAAVTLAEHGEAHAIIAVTRAGKTARRLSALRPHVPILAMTDQVETARRLTLYWGVFPIASSVVRKVDTVGTFVGGQLVERGLVPAGALVVLANVSPDLGREDANYLKIQRL